MFGRLLWKLLRSNRGRLTVALVALISGATVISALLNVEFDIERKLTQEFRGLGANVAIAAESKAEALPGAMATVDSTQLLDESFIANTIAAIKSQDVSASAPFLFAVARVNDTPVVVAGTWLDQLAALNPSWRLEGNWIEQRDDARDCLIGRKVAQQFGLAPGGEIALSYLGKQAQARVSGVIESGGNEDDQIFVSLPIAWQLIGEQGYVSLWQISVRGASAAIDRYIAQVSSALPAYDVRPIRAVTDAEGNLLARTRLLVVSMIVLILVLTAFCVLATMAALAMERRKDVGLMKALGGSISRILGLFLAELGTLGAAGGLIGCALGVVLARWIGERVFGASIQPHWDIFPLTIAMMVAVALAGALPLRLLGRVKPAVILRGE
jgi:putative ABC transport system permease protein